MKLEPGVSVMSAVLPLAEMVTGTFAFPVLLVNGGSAKFELAGSTLNV